jgi:hypothetical protein
MAYDWKIQVVVMRTSRKRKPTLDNTFTITTEKTMLCAKKDRVSEFLGVGMAISHATIDRAKEDEREV